jgi:hypothetical protein
MHRDNMEFIHHVWNVIYIPICILISPSLLEKKKDCKRFKSDLIRRERTRFKPMVKVINAIVGMVWICCPSEV